MKTFNFNPVLNIKKPFSFFKIYNQGEPFVVYFPHNKILYMVQWLDLSFDI